MRHGESEWNDRFAGRCNVSLSPFGIEEAREAGAYFRQRDLRFTRVLSSPLNRCLETIRIAAPRHESTIEVLSALSCRSYGLITGLNKAWVRRVLGERRYLNWMHSGTSGPPLGETFPALVERTTVVSDELAKLSETTRVLICSHAITIRGLLINLGVLSLEEAKTFKVRNCQPYFLSRTDQRAKWTLETPDG